MNAITLKAHFDGERICLDDPYPLQMSSKLLVTIFVGDSEDAERREWLEMSQLSLARIWAENDPDYSDAIIRERPV